MKSKKLDTLIKGKRGSDTERRRWRRQVKREKGSDLDLGK